MTRLDVQGIASIDSALAAGLATFGRVDEPNSFYRAFKTWTGTFRALHRIDDAEHRVTVIRVEHRADAYRRR